MVTTTKKPVPKHTLKMPKAKVLDLKDPIAIAELKNRHKAYMLRTCGLDMSAYGGFVWPKYGPVSCPDWDPGKHCGNGLHGLLWGAGYATLLNWEPEAPWLVVGIDEWVEIDGKVKAPSADVVYCGDLRGAADLLVSLGAEAGKCVGSAATAGTRGTATAGDAGTATAGDAGCNSIQYWDSKRERYCARIGYIGEDGLEAKVLYHMEGDKFVPAKKEND